MLAELKWWSWCAAGNGAVLIVSSTDAEPWLRLELGNIYIGKEILDRNQASIVK